jgi:tRNA pseudouridine55 synthase
MSKRRGKPIHGWLNIDKPAAMTSNTVVGLVRRFTGAAKAGHGGTLDPLATGVLPVALGEATKTASYVIDGAKTYLFTVRWGEARTTDDAEGEVTEISEKRPTDEEIVAALTLFSGQINQVPPAFSAIKVNGRRAYALARAHKPVELEARTVSVERFELVQRPDPDHARFLVTCGKGTYMRSLARDLALELGTVGHICDLRRTRTGPFSEETAIPLDKLEVLGHSAALAEALLPIETVLDDIPALALTEEEARSLRHGRPISVLPVATRSPLTNIAQGDVVCAMAGGKLVALARVVGGEVRPFRVMNH